MLHTFLKTGRLILFLCFNRSLLPECEDDQVVPWPIDELREQDWSEELDPR